MVVELPKESLFSRIKSAISPTSLAIFSFLVFVGIIFVNINQLNSQQTVNTQAATLENSVQVPTPTITPIP